MPEPLWIDRMALLYFTNFTTCSAIADAFDSASHDPVTRMLQGTWSGHTLLNWALRLLFTVAGGYLILDDPVIEKPYARLLGEAAWVWSSKQRQVVCGVSVVLLVWTDGQVRIPLAFRLWHKGGLSKCTLALELLSYARNRLRCQPQFVLFDSWYPSKPLLKRLRDYGWYFVCQLKKNRRFEGKPLVQYLSQAYWQATGQLAGGLKVFVVRYRRKYDATNRLSLSAKEVRTLYRKRQEVEEVIRVLQSHLRLEGCQAGYRRSSEEQPPFRCRLFLEKSYHGQAFWKAGHPSVRMTVAQPVISPQEAPMARPSGLLQWHQTVSTYLPHLSQPQLTVLVLWSFGIVLAQACGLTTVAVTLAYVLGCSEMTIREQLRDWYRDAQHKSGAKRGRKRRSLEVTLCFAPLLCWVVAWTDPTCRQLALAMDASTLGQRFTLLSISVVVRGCAIPVAWRVVEATRAGAWRSHWEALFGHLQGSVPADWTVIVLADRGLYARWLFTTIQALGWHPFLRINRQGYYRVSASAPLQPLTQVVSRVGQRWAGHVICFATPARQLACTLLARWDAGYRDPWLILTDLPPTTVDVAWYALRAWIECGFKDSKRGGWHWEQTKMLAPARAERLWLALAVATLWTVTVGCQAEVAQPRPQVSQLPEQHIARKRATGHRPARSLSCFRRGRLVILAALCLGQPLPVGYILPEPWPSSPETAVDRLCAYPPLPKVA